MRKLSQINEGIWTKGVERSKNDEKRIGDKTPYDNYFKNIEWVDLEHPKYLFAKNDFPELSINQLKIFINCIPEGIEILDKNLLDYLNNTCIVSKSDNSDIETYKSSNWKKKDEIYFDSSKFYFISFKPGRGGEYVNCLHGTRFATKYNCDDTDYSLKLIKKK